MLTDESAAIYTVPFLDDLTIDDDLWTDNAFRRSIRYRIRDIAIIATSAVIGLHADTHLLGDGDPLDFSAVASAVHLRGTLGARPPASAANAGMTYLAISGATHEGTYRSTGSAWEPTTPTISHQNTHQSGGGDALVGDLNATARVGAAKNDGALVGARRQINFKEGANTTLTIADDAINERVDVTIASAIVGSGAPASAPYITTAADAGLSAEVVLGSSVIMRGTVVSRPPASIAGRLYYVTDTGQARWTRDTGSTWEDSDLDWTRILNKPSTFTPTAHASAHNAGGGDLISVTNAIVAGGAAIAVSKLAGGTDGQVLTTVGTTPTWATFASDLAGVELSYGQRTTPVGISAVDEAGADLIVAGPAYTFNGSEKAVIEFSVPLASVSGDDPGSLVFVLFDNGTSVGIIATVGSDGGVLQNIFATRRLIPSTGVHNFWISAYVSLGATSGIVTAGAGVPETYAPGYIRIVRG